MKRVQRDSGRSTIDIARPAAPLESNPSALVALQRAAGNAAVTGLVAAQREGEGNAVASGVGNPWHSGTAATELLKVMQRVSSLEQQAKSKEAALSLEVMARQTEAAIEQAESIKQQPQSEAQREMIEAVLSAGSAGVSAVGRMASLRGSARSGGSSTEAQLARSVASMFHSTAEKAVEAVFLLEKGKLDAERELLRSMQEMTTRTLTQIEGRSDDVSGQLDDLIGLTAGWVQSLSKVQSWKH